MATKLRVQGPNLYQHITAAGNDRQAIFLDAEDNLKYLSLLEKALQDLGFELFAYALMWNHLHLLARFAQATMDQVMYFVQDRYAKYFNKRHGRSGHVFERRYYNEVVTTEEYLHEAGRYIHQNPVVAEIVSRPEDYPWSSFSEYWNEDFRLVRSDSPLVTCFKTDGAFNRQAFHDFTTARQRTAADPAWYAKGQYSKGNAGDPLREAADKNHWRVKTIVAGVSRGFGYWGDIRDSEHPSRTRDHARALAFYLLKEAFPAWPLERLKPLAGIADLKNSYRILLKCEERLSRDPLYKSIAQEIRSQLKASAA